MKLKFDPSLLFVSFIFLAVLFSCNGKTTTVTEIKDSLEIALQKPVRPEPIEKNERPPIINIVDSLAPKRIVVYCKDSSATYEGISVKLGNIFGEQMVKVIKKNKLKTAGVPMAWYKSLKAPYFFEAGIPVNKRPAKLSKGVYVREMKAGNAVIAHYYGPFDQLSMAYDAVKVWLKENKKKTNGSPYEMYVSDPVDEKGKPLDPYKVKTDIVFPIQ